MVNSNSLRFHFLTLHCSVRLSSIFSLHLTYTTLKITKGTLHFYGQRKTNISTVHSISLKKVQMSMLLLQVVTMLDIQVIFLDSVFLLSFEMKFDMRISKMYSAQNKNEVWPLNFVHWSLKSCSENSKSSYNSNFGSKEKTNKDTFLKCRFIRSNFFPN